MNEYEQFKKTYKTIQTPEYLGEKGWEDLSARLPLQDKPRSPIYRYSFVFAALLLLVTAGIVGASQTAQPGTVLYTVKEASDQINKNVNQIDTTKLTPKKILQKPTVMPPLTITPIVTKQPENKSGSSWQRNNSQNGNSQNNNNSSNDNKQEVQGAQTEKNNGNSGNNGNNGNGQGNGNSGSNHGNQKDK